MPGIKVNTARRLITIDLISTIPISGPILNCINVIATRPPTVVSELPVISGIAFESAMIVASLAGSVICSSLYLFRKITA